LETISQSTQQSLVLLIYASIFMLVFITFFLIKLLMDLSSLAKSLQSLVVVVKHDLAPTMKEFKRAMININAITQSTSSQFKGLNSALSDGLNIFSSSAKGVSGKAKIILASLREGLFTGLKVFMEEKKAK